MCTGIEVSCAIGEGCSLDFLTCSEIASSPWSTSREVGGRSRKLVVDDPGASAQRVKKRRIGSQW